MSMDLARQEFSTKEKYFIAGTTIPITTAVKQARGGPGGPHPRAAGRRQGDGRGRPGQRREARRDRGPVWHHRRQCKNGEDAVIYLTGEFFADELVLPQNVTAAALEVPLRNIGIFLK